MAKKLNKQELESISEIIKLKIHEKRENAPLTTKEQNFIKSTAKDLKLLKDNLNLRNKLDNQISNLQKKLYTQVSKFNNDNKTGYKHFSIEYRGIINTNFKSLKHTEFTHIKHQLVLANASSDTMEDLIEEVVSKY